MMTDQIIPGDLLTRAKVTSGLRQLADFLDTHPDVPVHPYGWDLRDFPQLATEAAGRAEIDRIACVLGTPVQDGTASGGYYIASRTFGLITYQAIHVPARRRALDHAEMTYAGCVTPDDSGSDAPS